MDEYIKKRNVIAEKYRAKINNINFQSSPSYVTKNGNMLFFGIAKNEKQKNKILDTFWKEKIDSRAAWLPVNLQPCNKELRKYKCKNSENNYKKIFTIPIYNTIKNLEVNKIIDIINSI